MQRIKKKHPSPNKKKNIQKQNQTKEKKKPKNKTKQNKNKTKTPPAKTLSFYHFSVNQTYLSMRCISRTCMSFNYNTACLFSIKKILLQSLNCSTFQMFSFSYRVRTVRIACAPRTFTVQFVISAPFALTIHYKAFTVCSLHDQHRFSVGPPFRFNSSSGIPKWKNHRKKYENKTDHVFLIPSAHSFNKV